MGDILRFRRQKRKNTSVVTLAMLGLTGGIALGSGILYFRSHPVSFASIAPVAMMTPVETANTAERDTIGCSNPHVVDGDTLRCGATRIRLHGIDAPETDGHCRVGRECAREDGRPSANLPQGLCRRSAPEEQVADVGTLPRWEAGRDC